MELTKTSDKQKRSFHISPYDRLSSEEFPHTNTNTNTNSNTHNLTSNTNHNASLEDFEPSFNRMRNAQMSFASQQTRLGWGSRVETESSLTVDELTAVDSPILPNSGNSTAHINRSRLTPVPSDCDDNSSNDFSPEPSRRLAKFQTEDSVVGGNQTEANNYRPKIKKMSGKTALIIMTVQIDLCEGGAIGINGANANFISNINRLRNAMKWDIVVWAQDQHPTTHRSFVSNNPGSIHGQYMRFGEEDILTLIDNCVEGDYGSELHPDLDIKPEDIIITTGVYHNGDHPSIFQDSNSHIQNLLEDAHVTNVFFCGLPLESKVLESAEQARSIFPHTFVVEDVSLCYLATPSKITRTLQKHGVHVVTIDDIPDLVIPSEPNTFAIAEKQKYDEIMAFAHGDNGFSEIVSQHINSLTPSGRYWVLEPNSTTGRCILHDLCRIFHPNAVVIAREILSLPTANLNVLTKYDEMSPLLIACGSGHVEMVHMLCSDNPLSDSVNSAVSDKRRMSAVMYAILSHNVEIVRELLEKNDEWWLLSTSDRYHRTPLFLACANAGIFGRSIDDARNNRGAQVLRYLWNKFPLPGFVDTQDAAGWQFWHYAVKHDLKEHLREKLILLTEVREVLEAPLKQHNQGIPVTLVRLAVWQASARVQLTSFGILKELLDLCNSCTPRITCVHELDLVIDDADPKISFMLVERGLVPWKKKNEPVIALLYKAIMFGRAGVVKEILTKSEFGAVVNSDLLSFTRGVKYFGCCSRHFISTYASTPQVCFRVSVDQQPKFTVCGACALACWAPRVGPNVEFVGIVSQVCECRHMSFHNEGCRCIQRREETADAPSAFPLASYPIFFPGRWQSDLKTAQNQAQSRAARMVPTTEAFSFHEYVFRIFLVSACGSEGSAELVREILGVLQCDGITMLDFALSDSLDTCFHVAALNNRVDVIRTLKTPLRQGVRYHYNLGRANKNGHFPITIAAIKGHVDACRELWELELVGKLDVQGLTPLHHAVREGHTAVVKLLAFLITNRNDLDIRRAQLGNWSIDHLFLPPHTQNRRSSQESSTSIPTQQTELTLNTQLVSQDVLLKGPGETDAHASPLHLAVRYGRADCVTALLNSGCNPFGADGTGYSPYKTAMWEQYKSRDYQSEDPNSTTSPTSNRAFLEPRTVGSIASVAPNPQSSNYPPTGPQFRIGAYSIYLGGPIDSARPRISLRFSRPNSPSAGSTHANGPTALSNMRNSFFMRSTSWMGDRTASNTAQHPDVARKVVGAMHNSKAVRKRSVAFAYTRFYLMSVWYLIMALLFLLFTLPTNSDRYFASEWISQGVADTETIATFQSSSQVWDYLEKYYISERALLSPPMGSLNTTIGVYLLGCVRLRQVRGVLREEKAEIDKTVRKPVTFAKWHDSDALKSGGWAVANYSVFGEGQFYDDDLGIPELFSGDFGDYPKGGYKVDLDKYDEATNLKILHQLRNNNWIDNKTRALFLYFNVYNNNLPIYSACRVLFEFAPTGELTASVVVLSHMIFTTSTQLLNLLTYYYPSDVFTGIIAGLLAFLVLSEAKDFLIHPTQYIREIGNLYDVAIGACCVVLLWWEVSATKEVEDLFPMQVAEWSESKRFFKLMTPLIKTELLTRMLSVVAILIWIRVLQYTVYLPTFGPIVRALVNTLKDPSIIAFTALLIFFVFGLSLALRSAVSFLPDTQEYRATFALLFSLVIGQWPSDEFIDELNLFGTMLILVCVVLMTVMMVNIFISILSDVYPNEKRAAEEQYIESLSELIEIDYRSRHNPLLTPIRGSKYLRALHTIFARPFLQVLARVIATLVTVAYFCMPRHIPVWLMRFHPSHEKNKEFGWERGLTHVVLADRQQSSGNARSSRRLSGRFQL